MPLLVLTGQRFGRLTVGERAPNRAGGRHVAWHCTCDCGEATIATTVHLRSGHTQSCGCLARERTAERARTHGHTVGRRIPPEYQVWRGIKDRCLNPNSNRWAEYGARGITVCDRWKDSFAAFYDDMGPRPSPRHSIDRIDNDGDYEPGNCRWATDRQQANNTRRNVTVTYCGERLTMATLARRVGVGYVRLWKLHAVHGIPLENAIDMIRDGRRVPYTQTHCRRGHPFTAENTIYNSAHGRRTCRICKNENARAAYARRNRRSE